MLHGVKQGCCGCKGWDRGLPGRGCQQSRLLAELAEIEGLTDRTYIRSNSTHGVVFWILSMHTLGSGLR